MGKKHSSFKKNKGQAYAYKNAVEKSSYTPEGTIPNSNLLLVGTGEVEENNTNIDNNAQIVKKPFKYVIEDWFKDNYISVLVSVFLIAIIGFLFGHGKSIAVINYRLDNIEKEISNLDSNVLNKDVLELKLDNLKKEIESKILVEVTEFKSQIEELEKELKYMNK